jgi:hypothetical protein
MAAVRSGRGKCGQVYSGASRSFRGLRSAGLHARASRTALGPDRSSPGEAVKVSCTTCHYMYKYTYIITIRGADELHGRRPEGALGV